MNTLAVHLKNCLVMCTCDKNDINIVHVSPVNTQHCNYPELFTKSKYHTVGQA